MKNSSLSGNKMLISMGAFFITICLVTMASLVASSQTNAHTQKSSKELSVIRELTGLEVSNTPMGAGYFYSEQYGVYLSDYQATPASAKKVSAGRANFSTNVNGTYDVLLIPESTNKKIMTFDAITGNLIDPNFITLDASAMTPIHAVLSSSGTILISDQVKDVVDEYDLSGNYLGIFAPNGGVDNNILDNIRGIALKPNGNLLVTVGSGPNSGAIAEFDTGGNYLGNFIAQGSGGLDSPFDIYERTGASWLVSEIDNDAILSYHLTTGAFLGSLAPINTFPEQIFELPNDNVLVANFSGTQEGIVELTSTGVLQGIYNPSSISGYRGVYQLPNGNLLTTTGTGVYEIDRSNNIISTKYSGGSCRFIQLASLPSSIQLTVTVGTVPGVCATTSNITVPAGTEVYYCYKIKNNTGAVLSLHDLVDSELGNILNGYNYTLAPGEFSPEVISFATPMTSVTNEATWTAYNAGPTDVYTATGSATVTVVPPSISLVVTVATTPGDCGVTNNITVPAGTLVYYCYQIQNNTSTTLTLHDLVDSELGNILSGYNYTLAPGEFSVEVVSSATPMTSVTNEATWTAYNAGPTDVYTATGSATVTVVPPSISLVVTVATTPGDCGVTNNITVPAGTLVYYCYQIQNNTSTTLTLHDLLDSELGNILSGYNYTLAPGESSPEVVSSATPMTSATNEATWTAYNAGPTDVYTATGSATVTVVPPSISLVVTVGTTPGVCGSTNNISVPAGTQVYYCYQIQNNTSTTLNLHDLVDSELGNILNGYNYTLAPGEFSPEVISFATPMTSVTNEATWTAYNAGPTDVYTATGSATVTVYHLIPLTNWALLIGMILMISFVLFRFILRHK